MLGVVNTRRHLLAPAALGLAGMLWVSCAGWGAEPQWRVGLARVQITPQGPIPMCGYVPMLQKALGPDRLWIAAYANESFGYLPTAKMLTEGGHETMCLTLATGFFSPAVEEVVVTAVRRLARKAGRKLPCPFLQGRPSRVEAGHASRGPADQLHHDDQGRDGDSEGEVLVHRGAMKTRRPNARSIAHSVIRISMAPNEY